jgi:hypothetical protein
MRFRIHRFVAAPVHAYYSPTPRKQLGGGGGGSDIELRRILACLLCDLFSFSTINTKPVVDHFYESLHVQNIHYAKD